MVRQTGNYFRQFGLQILLGLMIVFVLFQWLRPAVPIVAYSTFRSNLTQGNVSEIHVRGDEIKGVFEPPVGIGEDSEEKTTYFKTYLPAFGDDELMMALKDNDVEIHATSSQRSWLVTLLVGLLPWLLIIGGFIYLQRRFQQRMGTGGGGLLGFGRSKAKRFDHEMSTTRFDDVAGLGNAKKELVEVVDYLKTPDKYTRLGGKIPKGILLAGPPGTGKTLMARATAGEANVPFFNISGSEFIEMFVGVGASRVRDMFKTAKHQSPAIIFIDEIDSIGRARGTGLGGGHDEREQTLNQVLSEMDGFAPHESVIVLAATNRPDVLDPALVRPGRFDRRIVVDMPDKNARRQILEVHAKNIPLSDNVDLDGIAAQSIGFSGADLENLVNEAALLAGRQSEQKVDAGHFESSLDKIRLGIERDDVITNDEKEVIACHEAGHALVAKLLPGTDPLKKGTIVPDGQALGVTEQVPKEDRRNLNRTYLRNRLAVLLGGRAAEALLKKDVSTGAADDLQKATQLARRMVCRWGMSDAIGPVVYTDGQPHPFLGKELTQGGDHSETTARIIDKAIAKLLRNAERTATGCLDKNRDKLETLTRLLVDAETVSDAQIDAHLGLDTAGKSEACCIPSKQSASDRSTAAEGVQPVK